MIRFFVIVLSILSVAACATPSRGKAAIVYGESFATTSEAVQEAMIAVQAAESFGYRAVSVGGAGAGAASEVGGGLLINCYVLMEGPANAPDILPTTGRPPP